MNIEVYNQLGFEVRVNLNDLKWISVSLFKDGLKVTRFEGVYFPCHTELGEITAKLIKRWQTLQD